MTAPAAPAIQVLLYGRLVVGRTILIAQHLQELQEAGDIDSPPTDNEWLDYHGHT